MHAGLSNGAYMGQWNKIDAGGKERNETNDINLITQERLMEIPWQVICVRELADNPDAFQIKPGNQVHLARRRMAAYHSEQANRCPPYWLDLANVKPAYLSVCGLVLNSIHPSVCVCLYFSFFLSDYDWLNPPPQFWGIMAEGEGMTKEMW